MWGSEKIDVNGGRKFSHAHCPQKFYEAPCILLRLWKPFNTLCFASIMFVAVWKRTRMYDGCIDGDKPSEFAMKGEIAMNFRMFCLLEPGYVDLTYDRK